MNEQYTVREEWASAITHCVGIVASVAGGAVLITLSAVHGHVWPIVAATVFTLSLILLYTASTLYHAIGDTRCKARLKVLDHSAIFLLIAGTYTPFTLLGLHGSWGWILFGISWSLAVAGIAFKLFFTGRFKRASTLIYVAMGWLIVVAIGPLVRDVPTSTIAWLIAGGIAYTAGTVFYHNRQIPYSHAIWHGFVLCGSVLHYIAVASLLIPLARA
jgi:hemolysin III